MDIKTFALQEWCERDLIILHKIHTQHNWADALTKAQSKILFHRHMHHIMGKIPPKYCNKMIGNSVQKSFQSHAQNMRSGEGVRPPITNPT